MENERVRSYCVMPEDMYLGKKYSFNKLFVDDRTYDGLVSPLSRKGNAGQFHIGVFEEGRVLAFAELNPNMKKAETVSNYLDELAESLCRVISENVEFSGSEPDITIRFGEMSEHDPEQKPGETALRLLIMLKDFSDISGAQEESLRKKLVGELNNWVEEVVHDRPYEAPKEDYANDITFRMGADMLPHDKEAVGGMDSTMAIFALLFAVIGIFLHEYYVFGVMAAVIGFCFAFRSYQHERYIVMALCMLAAIIGLTAVGWEYISFRNSIQEATASVILFRSIFRF